MEGNIYSHTHTPHPHIPHIHSWNSLIRHGIIAAPITPNFIHTCLGIRKIVPRWSSIAATPLGNTRRGTAAVYRHPTPPESNHHAQLEARRTDRRRRRSEIPGTDTHRVRDGERLKSKGSRR